MNIYFILIIILIILFIILFLFLNNKNKKNNINNNYINNLKEEFKKDVPEYLKYSLNNNNYGMVVDDYEDDYFSSKIYKSNVNYQLAFLIKEDYIKYISISIIEYDLAMNPKKRVIYNNNQTQIYYYNYTVLNNIYYRLIFKWNDDYIQKIKPFYIDNINELIDIILIKINMNDNIENLVENNFYLNKHYFEYGSICNNDYLFNSSINSFKFLLNMVLPLFKLKNISKILTINNIFNNNLNIKDNITLYPIDSNFKNIIKNESCAWNNIEINSNISYFVLLINNLNNDTLNNLNEILKSLKFELKDKIDNSLT